MADTYHVGVSSLPVSVRVALWATAAYQGRLDIAQVMTLAAPDVPCHGGRLDALGIWQSLGEQAVLVALPRPGDIASMPRGSGDFVAAATDAGECVYVAGLGAALVPRWGFAGGPGERSPMLTWELHDCQPMPVHQLEALSLREIDMTLRQELIAAIADLESMHAQPWAGHGLRELADARIGAQTGGRLGLPEGLPARTLRTIALSSTLAAVADVGLEQLPDAQSLADTFARTERLRRLQVVADTCLAAATSVAAMSLAGWRSAIRD